MTTFPLLSTAAQKDDEGHDTELSSPTLSIWTGALHELPLNLSARPFPSTAMQNDAETHDTSLSPSPPNGLLAVQVLPLNVSAASP
jgi:hypothetical protein